MKIIFYWRFIEIRAMQLLSSNKNPHFHKEVRKFSYLKSKTNGSKAVALMRLNNSQIIMFERAKINLACVFEGPTMLLKCQLFAQNRR